MSWRTVAHVDRLRLLTRLRESHQSSLLSQQVQANMGKFAPCHKEWPIPCPNKISLETRYALHGFEWMRNHVAFHVEMMGHIMYLQQVLRQPDAKEFVQAVIKEVNGYLDCNN
jgi:hypothetical protein